MAQGATLLETLNDEGRRFSPWEKNLVVFGRGVYRLTGHWVRLPGNRIGLVLDFVGRWDEKPRPYVSLAELQQAIREHPTFFRPAWGEPGKEATPEKTRKAGLARVRLNTRALGCKASHLGDNYWWFHWE